MAFEPNHRAQQHLTQDLVAWLTTVTPAGRPAPRPVWFMWDQATVRIYSLNEGAKLRHLQNNNQVALHFNSAPDGTDVVVISGRADVAPGAVKPSEFPGFLDKYAARIEQMGKDASWYDSLYSVGLDITPERAWTIPS